MYANSTKSLTHNFERITPAIKFWTSSVLNTRESEEISSGGFGIHDKQEDVEGDIPSTQIVVKQEIDEEGIKEIVVNECIKIICKVLPLHDIFLFNLFYIKVLKMMDTILMQPKL